MKTQHQPTMRVLRVLEATANGKKGLTLSQLAAVVNSPKSTLYPIIQTLTATKYLHFSENTQQYTLGMRCFEMGQHFFDRLDVLKEIKYEMCSIVNACSETCHLGILDKGDVLYLHKEDSLEPIRMFSSVGKRLPAYGTGLGKALLCDFSQEELKKIYPKGLKPLTENTITDFSLLHKQLERVRLEGIAYEKEESNMLIQCVAIPLRKNGLVQAAISVAIPIFRATPEKQEKLKQLLLAMQKKIELLLTTVHYDFSYIK